MADSTTPPDDLDPRQQHSHEGLNGKGSSSHSQQKEEHIGHLRTAPTDKLGHGDAERRESDAAPKPPAKPMFTRILDKLGLTPPLLVIMLKGSLPPIIGICMYQATPIRDILMTLGYLVPIISVLSLCILPRGKYLQNLVLNLLAISVGGALAMLATWSAVQARLNTSDLLELRTYIAKNGRAPYNSSQSAVLGVWLFANIWLVNVLRARLPAFSIPTILYSIVVNVACTFGPAFPTAASAESFVKQLITAMFLGVALATVVNLFVFPMSSRSVVMMQLRTSIGLFRKAIALEKDHLQALEREDMCTLELMETAAGTGTRTKGNKKQKKEEKEKLVREQRTAIALRETLTALREIRGKIHSDLKFAKRDVAWGKLDADEISEFASILRSVSIPIMGIGTMMDIFQRAAKSRGGDTNDANALPAKEDDRRIWNVHEAFEILYEAIDQGLEHASIILELVPRPKEQKKAAVQTAAADDADVEAAAGSDPRPGEPGFAAVFEKKLHFYLSQKSKILRVWAMDKGLSNDGKIENWDQNKTMLFEKRQEDQSQLYVLLYMEKLVRSSLPILSLHHTYLSTARESTVNVPLPIQMRATGSAVNDVVAFAESKLKDGTMSKKRFIFPNRRRVTKWLLSVFKTEDTTGEESPDVVERGINVVFLGDGYAQKKDPEHLPATNVWQHIGNGIRKGSAFFGSEESVFGFRVACATMTIGIVAFLESTQQFFIEQRLVWAMIIIAIGMTQTSGQSIFGFFCRVGGTLIAMINTYIIWYMMDEKTPGIIVFLWFFVFAEYAFFVKYTQFVPAVMICIVTQVMIIGYELQVRTLGVAASEASGQPYYPLYELAPYRLATVAGGALIAFFWTVFPSPFTDRTWLRKDLSAVLYLLANYFSVINTTMRAMMSDTAGDITIEGSPAHSLSKVRWKLYGKLTLLLPSLQAHASFQKFEPSVGGKFPAELYQDMILRCTRIMNYLTLISYVITWAPDEAQENPDTAWMRVFSEAMTQISPTHHTIVSTLILLSNSLLSGQSLPPLLPLPKPYEMTRQLLKLGEEHGLAEEQQASTATSVTSTSSLTNNGGEASTKITLGPDAWNLLDARNMEQKGYTEFSVLQVCNTLVIEDLEGIVKTVRDLVGTVDFSFRVDELDDRSSKSMDRATSRATWFMPAKTSSELEKRKTKVH